MSSLLRKFQKRQKKEKWYSGTLNFTPEFQKHTNFLAIKEKLLICPRCQGRDNPMFFVPAPDQSQSYFLDNKGNKLEAVCSLCLGMVSCFSCPEKRNKNTTIPLEELLERERQKGLYKELLGLLLDCLRGRINLHLV